MQIKYMRVWQGSGGSNGTATLTSKLNSTSYNTAGLTLPLGARVDLRGVSLLFTNGGNLEITDARGNIVWQTNTPVQCSGTCRVVFQNDGNLVLYGPTNAPYWTSKTWNNNVGSMTFSNQAPYIEVIDGNAKVLWTAGVTRHVTIPTG
jgi:hypothetical protein